MKRLTYFLAIMLLAGIALTATGATAVPRKDEKKKFPIEKPDMEQIKREVNDTKGKYYYPRLMAKYMRNDSAMSHQDFRHLYLGALFQEDYDPYRKNELDDKVKTLYYRKDHTRAELDTIMEYARECLENDPFDLEQLEFLVYAYNQRGKTNLAKIYQFKLNHLLAAILSTGTGADRDNAWIITSPKHEHYIIEKHGGTIQDVEYQQPYYEFARLVPAEGKSKSKTPEGYYFNLKYLLDEYYRKYPNP